MRKLSRVTIRIYTAVFRKLANPVSITWPETAEPTLRQHPLPVQ